jgi:hypothetical protein
LAEKVLLETVMGKRLASSFAAAVVVINLFRQAERKVLSHCNEWLIATRQGIVSISHDNRLRIHLKHTIAT